MKIGWSAAALERFSDSKLGVAPRQSVPQPSLHSTSCSVRQQHLVDVRLDGIKVLNAYFSTLLCFASKIPTELQKTATYRSLRFLQLAALVPSAGTISLSKSTLGS